MTQKKKYGCYKPNLPREVEEKIRKIIETYPELGYRNVGDFLLDAVRED